MHGFNKFIHILIMLLGFWAGNFCLFVAISEQGRKDIVGTTDTPAAVIILIFALIAAVCYFLFVYNIICLKKGYDVFINMIFHKEKKSSYKSSYSSSSSKSSYSSSYSSSSTKSSGSSSTKTTSTSHSFDWYDIQKVVEGTSRVSVWMQNAWVEIDNVYVKETSNYSFRIELHFKARGNVTIKNESDAKKVKESISSAADMLVKNIDSRLTPYYNKYGFGYQFSGGDIDTSDLKISSY